MVENLFLERFPLAIKIPPLEVREVSSEIMSSRVTRHPEGRTLNVGSPSEARNGYN